LKSFIKKVIDERRVSLFLAFIIAIFGMISYYLLPKQESPDVSAPVAMIITPYPGASPKDVKDLVASKIEDELSDLEGIDYIRSDSKNNVAITIIMFENYVDNEYAMQQVRNKINDAKKDLPDGVMDSIVDTNLVESAGIIISLSGDNYSYEQLASFAEQFEDELTRIDGVSRFELNGKVEKEIEVKIDLQELNAIKLSLEDIYNILKMQNLSIPSGNLNNNDKGKINVSTPGIFTSLKDIENVIVNVSTQTGVVTRLKDIADISFKLEDGVEKFRNNGKKSVLLTGYFQEGKNVVIIGKDVRKKLDEIKSKLPQDLIVTEVLYQPQDVSNSVNNFMLNLVEGIVLVIIVVFIGMGLRNAIVVSTAIPLSILMSFVAMYLSSIKIHQMSTAALIIALGMLVDNAIVISDAIQVKLDEGEDKIDAAINATNASSIPIFASTITTIVAFSPLLGIPGGAGDFLEAIPLVVIISLIAAYIVAMFVTPAMSVIFFKANDKNKKKKQSKIRALFDYMLDFSLNKRFFIVVLMLIALFVTGISSKLLNSEFFPKADKDLVYIEIESEVAANMDATQKLAVEVENLIKDEEEILNYTTSIGNGIPKFYISLEPPVPADENSQILLKVDLSKGDEFSSNDEFAIYLQEKIDQKIAGGKVTVKLLENAMPSDAPVILRLMGDDTEELIGLSKQIQHEITKIDGTKNVRDDSKIQSFEYKVDIDSDIATNLGISKYDIQRQINIALKGSKASDYRKDGKEYSIIVNSNIETKEELENLDIKSTVTKNKIPLKQFASISLNSKRDLIKTYQRKESVSILSDVKLGYNSSEVENIIENEILPKIELNGVLYEFDGEREDIVENFGSVAKLALVAIFVIYIVLLIQFNSFIQPFVILLTVPLSVIGSIWGLIIFVQPLSMTAFLGIVSLIGLVVKNAILLIEFINDARKNGHSISDSCKDAVNKRFSPIMLGTVTTVMGLIPLAFSGSELFAPMAVSLMSGLLVSTFLTMVVVPVFYSLFEEEIHKYQNHRHDNNDKGNLLKFIKDSYLSKN
jgi:multidrug efflux pump subunit AcrB